MGATPGDQFMLYIDVDTNFTQLYKATFQEETRIIKEFAILVRQGLKLAAFDFEAKRKILALLDVQVTLVVENKEKVVYAKCRVGDATMMITSKTIGGSPAEPEHSMR